MSYYLYLIVITRIPFTVNIIVQILDSNVVLGILGFNHYLNLFLLLYLVN